MAIAEFGQTCALKMAPLAAIHKSEMGGVLLHVSVADAETAFAHLAARMRQLNMEPCVLVTPMAKGDVECVIGGFRDHQFGPVVMAGLGGTRVELLNDVAFRLAPIVREDVSAMLAETALARIFAGHRGGAQLDLESFATLLCDVGELMHRNESILELDLNPVLVNREAAIVLDVRIAVEASDSASEKPPH